MQAALEARLCLIVGRGVFGRKHIAGRHESAEEGLLRGVPTAPAPTIPEAALSRGHGASSVPSGPIDAARRSCAAQPRRLIRGAAADDGATSSRTEVLL